MLDKLWRHVPVIVEPVVCEECEGELEAGVQEQVEEVHKADSTQGTHI